MTESNPVYLYGFEVMLQNYFLDSSRERSRPANNKKRFENEWLKNMSFSEFIEYQIEGGITEFYEMTPDSQALAIVKYYDSLDYLDASDMFYDRNFDNNLVLQIKKLLRFEETDVKFASWIRKTVYERCLPLVQREIEDAYKRSRGIQTYKSDGEICANHGVKLNDFLPGVK